MGVHSRGASERVAPVTENVGPDAPLESESYRYEVFVEVDPSDDDDDDDDLGHRPDGCGVCGRPGPVRLCRLDSATQPGDQWTIASTWHVCSGCLATIALGDPVALKGRLRIQDQTAPYVEVLVAGLLGGIHPDG